MQKQPFLENCSKATENNVQAALRVGKISGLLKSSGTKGYAATSKAKNGRGMAGEWQYPGPIALTCFRGIPLRFSRVRIVDQLPDRCRLNRVTGLPESGVLVGGFWLGQTPSNAA